MVTTIYCNYYIYKSNFCPRYGPGGVNNAVSSSQQQSTAATSQQQQYEQQPTNNVISTTNSAAAGEQQPLHITISHSPEQQQQLGSPVTATTSLWEQWDGDNGAAWGVPPTTTPQSHSPSSTAQLWHESWQLVSHGGDAQLYGQSEQYGIDGIDSSGLW